MLNIHTYTESPAWLALLHIVMVPLKATGSVILYSSSFYSRVTFRAGSEKEEAHGVVAATSYASSGHLISYDQFKSRKIRKKSRFIHMPKMVGKKLLQVFGAEYWTRAWIRIFFYSMDPVISLFSSMIVCLFRQVPLKLGRTRKALHLSYTGYSIMKNRMYVLNERIW